MKSFAELIAYVGISTLIISCGGGSDSDSAEELAGFYINDDSSTAYPAIAVVVAGDNGVQAYQVSQACGLEFGPGGGSEPYSGGEIPLLIHSVVEGDSVVCETSGSLVGDGDGVIVTAEVSGTASTINLERVESEEFIEYLVTLGVLPSIDPEAYEGDEQASCQALFNKTCDEVAADAEQ